MGHKFDFRWNLSDITYVRPNGCKVFSTFSCGGGSSMGYKLAGYDVIGNLEIDRKKNEAYIRNLHPRLNFCDDIRTFRQRNDLPEELYNLDVLDGSPPCKSFSVCGSREDTWGKEVKKYGITQVWDDLFFEYIALAKKLRPKVLVAENVKGILLGEATDYVRRIFEGFDDAGYYFQYFLLNAAKMGVPQKRERVFFIGIRKDIADDNNLSEQLTMLDYGVRLDMDFDEPPILFREVKSSENDYPLTEAKVRLWNIRKHGDVDLSYSCERAGENPNKFFNYKYIYDDAVANTELAQESCILFSEPRFRNKKETILCAAYPQDYDFGDCDVHELCGRAVPPVMMAQISSRIYEQYLSKLKQ